MFSIFSEELSGRVVNFKEQKKEGLVGIIEKYSHLPQLKLSMYNGKCNYKQKKNIEVFSFLNKVWEFASVDVLENRLNGITKQGVVIASSITPLEAAQLCCSLIKEDEYYSTQNNCSPLFKKNDLYKDVCWMISQLAISSKPGRRINGREQEQKEASQLSWIDACSYLQKELALFDSDLEVEGNCPKISKMAQLFGVKKARGIYFRSIEDLSAVATIFTGNKSAFYLRLKNFLNGIVKDKISKFERGHSKEQIINEQYNSVNITITTQVDVDCLNLIKTNMNNANNLARELGMYIEKSDDYIDDMDGNPYIFNSGLFRKLLKYVWQNIDDSSVTDFEDRNSDELIKDLYDYFQDEILVGLPEKFNVDITNGLSIDRAYFNIELKTLRNINMDEVVGFIRNALICLEGETYLRNMKLFDGTAEKFRNNVNKKLFECGLRELQVNDFDYFIDNYIYNALLGEEKYLRGKEQIIREL